MSLKVCEDRRQGTDWSPCVWRQNHNLRLMDPMLYTANASTSQINTRLVLEAEANLGVEFCHGPTHITLIFSHFQYIVILYIKFIKLSFSYLWSQHFQIRIALVKHIETAFMNSQSAFDLATLASKRSCLDLGISTPTEVVTGAESTQTALRKRSATSSTTFQREHTGAVHRKPWIGLSNLSIFVVRLLASTNSTFEIRSKTAWNGLWGFLL